MFFSSGAVLGVALACDTAGGGRVASCLFFLGKPGPLEVRGKTMNDQERTHCWESL